MADSLVSLRRVIEGDVSDRQAPVLEHARNHETTHSPSSQSRVSNSIFSNPLEDRVPTCTAHHRNSLHSEPCPSSQLPPRSLQSPLTIEDAQNNKSIRGTHEFNTNLLDQPHAHETDSSTSLAGISHATGRTQSYTRTNPDVSCPACEQNSSTLRPAWSNLPGLQPHERSSPSVSRTIFSSWRSTYSLSTTQNPTCYSILDILFAYSWPQLSWAQPTPSSQMMEYPPLLQTNETPVNLGQRYLESSSHSTQERPVTLNDHISYGIIAQTPDVTVPDTGHTRKRGLDDVISGSTKRLREDQGELTVRPMMGEVNDTREQHTKTASESASSHELGSSKDNSSFRTEVSHGSGTQGLHRESTSGFFSNSSNFVIQEPIMIDKSHHNHVQNKGPSETLLWLKDYIMTGAEFDSSERDPPPRCHPNTRASIIERTNNWIKDPHREKNLLWVRGAAGVGKSAIVQTVLESLPEELLGGSVFFSKPRGRNNPTRLFTSIAYQLAVRDMPYRDYLTELMLKDPLSLRKSMMKQFHILFEEPFVDRKLRDGQNTLVIAIDGLDECGGDSNQGNTDQRRRSSEQAQCEIVRLITNFVLQHPSIPLVWIIASRPENYLHVKFHAENISESFLEENIPVDSTEACNDVEVYLNAEFTRIREKHPDLITKSPWPSSKDFSLISSKASGLFIFAEVVIRFVQDPNPIRQLREVLTTIKDVPATKSNENPLAFLDAMYTEIFSKVTPELLEPAKRIIGNIAFLDDHSVERSIACLGLICNVLSIPQDIALTALRPLHSVLYFPQVYDVGATRPRFYHASFRDFLEDESRSHRLSVKKYEVCDELFEGLSKLAQDELPHKDSLPWPGKKNLRKLREGFQSLNKGIPAGIASSSSIDLFGVSLPISEGLPLAFWKNFDFAKAIRQDSYIGFEMRKLDGERIRTLKDNEILSHQSLQSLGIDSKTVSKCHVQASGCGYFVTLNEELKCELKEDTLEVHKCVCQWVEAGPKRVVRVWGREKFRRCVVIKTAEICDETYGSVVFVGF